MGRPAVESHRATPGGRKYGCRRQHIFGGGGVSALEGGCVGEAGPPLHLPLVPTIAQPWLLWVSEIVGGSERRGCIGHKLPMKLHPGTVMFCGSTASEKVAPRCGQIGATRPKCMGNRYVALVFTVIWTLVPTFPIVLLAFRGRHDPLQRKLLTLKPGVEDIPERPFILNRSNMFGSAAAATFERMVATLAKRVSL